MTTNEPFPESIYKVFPRDKLESLPVLDIGTRRGYNDYINFLKPDDLSDPIMRGRDISERAFITFLYKQGSGNRVITIFQRYGNSEDCWVLGGVRFEELEFVTSFNPDGCERHSTHIKTFLNILRAALNGELSYTYTVRSIHNDPDAEPIYTVVFPGLGG